MQLLVSVFSLPLESKQSIAAVLLAINVILIAAVFLLNREWFFPHSIQRKK